MHFTSAQAAKELRAINTKISELLTKERKTSSFVAALGEDPESLRPEYDYYKTETELARLEERLRKLKHALNVFNSTHVVDKTGMTIDEILIAMPQLTTRINTLRSMSEKLPKERCRATFGPQANLVEYSYTNYDIDAVKEELEREVKLLTLYQVELDKCNSTVEFEIEF